MATMLSDSVRQRFASPRSTASAALLVAFGREQGLEASELLAGTGIPEPALHDPSCEIAGFQELQVAANLTDRVGDSGALGLELGARYHLTSQGMCGFALLGCRTVREAVLLGLRYLELTCVFTRLLFEERPGEASLVIHDEGLPPAVRSFVLHRDVAALCTVRRDLVGAARVPLRKLTARGAPEAPLEAYAALWGRVPDFGAQRHESVFDAWFLDLLLPQANAHAVRLAEEQCRAMLARRRVSSGVRGLVRTALRAQPGDVPDMDGVASGLGMSARTLRRRLREEQTSYREILDEVRSALADELLQRGSTSVAEVADQLGYADTSSFVHAFKRMVGTTPGRARSRPREPQP
jgi:AraC-like DNA-binding protein